MELLITLIISAAIFGVIGMAIGDLGGKKNGPVGFLLGALLGPIGCIIAAVIPPAADSEKAKGEAAEKQRLAKLEAELAALKNGKVAAGTPLMKAKVIPVENDGEVPTYRLD